MPKGRGIRAVLLLAKRIAAGILLGFFAAILISYIFGPPRHVHPAPGDGIIVLLLLMVLVPLGALVGGISAIVTLEKFEPLTRTRNT